MGMDGDDDDSAAWLLAAMVVIVARLAPFLETSSPDDTVVIFLRMDDATPPALRPDADTFTCDWREKERDREIER